MKLIPLTQGKFAQVDDEDYEYLIQWKWFAYQGEERKTFYAVRNGGYEKKSRLKSIKMHRVIMGVSDTNVLIDHADRNGLNNQKLNLRKCNVNQNNWNRKANEKVYSKYIGVDYVSFKSSPPNNRNEYYRARIQVYGKSIFLGYFPLTKEGEILAAKTRDEAAKKYHGNFASLNFITND